MGSRDDALSRRVRFRLLETLRQLERCRARGLDFPDSVSEEKLEECRRLLQPGQRWSLGWYRSVELPLRRALRSAAGRS